MSAKVINTHKNKFFFICNHSILLNTDAIINTAIVSKVITCDDNPCQNGGLCNDDDGTYSCKCTSGFMGVNCESSLIGRLFSFSELKFFLILNFKIFQTKHAQAFCDKNFCENGGTCYSSNSLQYCVCINGIYGDRCEFSK